MLNAQIEEMSMEEALPPNRAGELLVTLGHRPPSSSPENGNPGGGIDILARLKACQTQPSHDRTCDDEILDLLKITAHDLRSGIFSVGAALKLLKRGSFGGMEIGVSQELDNLYGYLSKLMGNLEEALGRAFSLSEGLVIRKETIHLQRDVLTPVLVELARDLRQSFGLFHNALESAPPEQLMLLGDRFWLKAVFRNLLRNALKYGGKGVKLAVGFQNQDSLVRINVYNSGKPITPECSQSLFTRFGHLTPSQDGKSNGLGLGLYLVKQAIERHGGKIWYEAKEHGSNFVFTLAKG
ncbi:MAG: HAMP domain-containing sensor histidine kinase [Thermodesulfobacteriota bacterium]